MPRASWQNVGRKRRKSTITDIGNASNVSDNNIYEDLLEDVESDSSNSEIIHFSPRAPRIKRVQQEMPPLKQVNTQRTNNTTIVNRTEKPPPPITILNVRMEQLIHHMADFTDEHKAKINYRITRSGMKIYSPNKETHKKVLDHVKRKQLTGFTHTAKEDQMIKICIYGLFPMKPELLASELEQEKFRPEKVRLMYTNPKYPDEAVYVVYFKKSQKVTIEKLKVVTGMFGLRVSFAYYKNKDAKITQCGNCQALGHGTVNCFKAAACVRCAEPHKSVECPLIPQRSMDNAMNEDGSTLSIAKPQIPEELLKCALCKKSGHSAAWTQCEVKLRHKSERQALQNQQVHKRRQTQQVNLSSAKFPMLKPVTVHPLQTSYHSYIPVPQTSVHPETNDNLRDKFLSVDECMKLIDYFTSELMKCKSVPEQIRTIAKLSLYSVQKYQSCCQLP